MVQGHTQYPTKTLDNFQRHQSLDSGAPSVSSRGRGEGLTPPTAGPSRGGGTAAAGSERGGGGAAAAEAVKPKAATGSIQREGAAAASNRPKGVTRSYKEEANSNRPIGPYKAVRYLT